MKSMTGYGCGSAAADGRTFSVELKSVNHRFLDLNIRQPRALLFLEDDLRKEIGDRITRGHVEVSVTYRNTREDAREVTLDTALVEQYKKVFAQITDLGFQNDIRVSDVIRIPEVMTVTPAEDDKDAVLELMRQAVASACSGLNATREKEGQRIEKDLLVKLTTIGSIAKDIEAFSENNLAEFAARLRKRLDDLLGDNAIDPQRLAQEVALYADKIAIDEELVRLETHIVNMRAYMSEPEAVGRKLDFFIQELNREVNTIGSKSVNAEIAKLVVSAKGEIEKLREQIQNIE